MCEWGGQTGEWKIWEKKQGLEGIRKSSDTRAEEEDAGTSCSYLEKV